MATAARFEFEGGDPRVAPMRAELAARDEIIVALQHVIRDLRHELENLRVAPIYGAFAGERSPRNHAEYRPLPELIEYPVSDPDAAAAA